MEECDDEQLEGAPTSLEGLVLERLAAQVDAYHERVAVMAVQGTGRTAATMQSHAHDVFTTNTEEGTTAKFADWHIYCKLVYGSDNKVPELAETNWPLSEQTWISFLVAARSRVSSFKRLSQNIGHVSFIAIWLWERQHGKATSEVNPRKLYWTEHMRVLNML